MGSSSVLPGSVGSATGGSRKAGESPSLVSRAISAEEDEISMGVVERISVNWLQLLNRHRISR